MAESFFIAGPGGTTRGNYSYGARIGWVVGRFDWLNSVDSKVERYWRVIEEGSAATKWPWVGQQIIGLWGPNAGTMGQDRNNLIDGSPLTAMGAGSNQRFVPFFAHLGASEADLLRAAHAALYYYFGGGRGPNMSQLNGGSVRANRRIYYWLMTKAGLTQMPFVRGSVVKPITAAHYYQNALRSFGPAEVEMQELRRLCDQFFGGVNPGTSRGMANLRRQVGDEQGVAPRTGRVRSRPETSNRRPFDSYLPAGSIAVALTGRTTDMGRNAKGQFSNDLFRASIEDVGREVAKRFQLAVVREMESGRRPATGDLARATASERNRFPV